VHRWGDDVVRWRLDPTDTGCGLTLEQTMRERDKAAMVGPAAMEHGWEPLRDSYIEVLGL
jgi:hypothetical protein